MKITLNKGYVMGKISECRDSMGINYDQVKENYIGITFVDRQNT